MTNTWAYGPKERSTMLEKLTSRKFLVTVATFVALHFEDLPPKWQAALTSAAAAVYVTVQGWIDKTRNPA